MKFQQTLKALRLARPESIFKFIANALIGILTDRGSVLSFITTTVSRELLKLIADTLDDDVIYGDTDSIFVKKTEKTKIEKIKDEFFKIYFPMSDHNCLTCNETIHSSIFFSKNAKEYISYQEPKWVVKGFQREFKSIVEHELRISRPENILMNIYTKLYGISAENANQPINVVPFLSQQKLNTSGKNIYGPRMSITYEEFLKLFKKVNLLMSLVFEKNDERENKEIARTFFSLPAPQQFLSHESVHFVHVRNLQCPLEMRQFLVLLQTKAIVNDGELVFLQRDEHANKTFPTYSLCARSKKPEINSERYFYPNHSIFLDVLSYNVFRISNRNDFWGLLQAKTMAFAFWNDGKGYDLLKTVEKVSDLMIVFNFGMIDNNGLSVFVENKEK